MRMTFRSKVLPSLVPVFVLLLASVGCRRDKELTQMQAEVNRAATELVIQDAEARRQWMEAQKLLDADRRQLAREQRRDPIIAQAILHVGGIALCLLPLWLIARLLRRSESDPVFYPIDDMVFDELIGHAPPGITPDPPQPSGLKLAHRDLNALIDDRLSRRRQ